MFASNVNQIDVVNFFQGLIMHNDLDLLCIKSSILAGMQSVPTWGYALGDIMH